MKLLRGRREEPGNEAMFVCMLPFEPWPAVADSKRGCVGMYSMCISRES